MSSNGGAGGLRVVIVDNDDTVVELLALDLPLEGHEVVATASSGEDAVGICRDVPADVLVVDLRLGPGIDGLEVARRASRPGLRIILHTNYVNAHVLEAAAGLGVAVVEKGSLRALRRAVSA